MENIMKIKWENTNMANNYGNILLDNNITRPSDAHCSTTFKLAIGNPINFLKVAKHQADHIVLKFVDVDDEFIAAFETSLEEDDEGGKSFAVGVVFNEDDLDITENTKVYKNTDAMYTTTFKETIKDFLAPGSEMDSTLEYYSITLPIKVIKDYSREAFNNVDANVVEVEIEDVGIVTYEKIEDYVQISLSLHQNLKQAIKADGNTDIFKQMKDMIA